MKLLSLFQSKIFMSLAAVTFVAGFNAHVGASVIEFDEEIVQQATPQAVNTCIAGCRAGYETCVSNAYDTCELTFNPNTQPAAFNNCMAPLVTACRAGYDACVGGCLAGPAAPGGAGGGGGPAGPGSTD